MYTAIIIIIIIIIIIGAGVATSVAYHQLDPGSIPAPGLICENRLSLVFSSLREVFLWVSPFHKNQHCQTSI